MKILEDVLKIEDPVQRRKALLETARAFQVVAGRAEKDNGRWDEDLLTVLIYDAVKKRQASLRQRLGLAAGAAFLVLVMAAAILLMVRLISAHSG